MRSTTLCLLASVSSLTGCSEIVGEFTFYDNDGAVQFPDAACAMMCSGVCTDTNRDPQHCGSCARSCGAPDHATATCVDAVCGFECAPGYARVLGTCVERIAPRPIAPLSTSTVTSRRPTFRWELAPRADGARLEICEDRACNSIIQTIDVAGSRASPSQDLPTGVVFWRLFSREGGELGTVPSPTWQMHVGARTAPVDTSWGTRLDVNGDGFGDIVVGAPGASRAYVFHGQATGLDTTAERVTTLTGPDFGNYGYSVASAGDVNGDGFADVVIGAQNAESNAGQVYLYFGSASGLVNDPERVTILRGPDAESFFGRSVAAAGDIDADGVGDLLGGAPGANSSRGRAYVYRGRDAAGGVHMNPTVLYGGVVENGQFGWSVASAGDVDGDGFGDLVIGAWAENSFAGRTYVYLGSTDGVRTTPGTVTPLAGPEGGGFGYVVASAGDINGDGLADILVGAPYAASSSGRAYLYVARIDNANRVPLTGSDGSSFGWSVSGAGDVDGNGFADFIVGARGESSNAGRSYVYLARADGSGPEMARLVVGPDVADGAFGSSVAGAGDVDGDGFADVVVGAHGMNSRRGRAYLYRGPSGLTSEPQRLNPEELAEPFLGQGTFGYSVAGAQ